MTSELSDILVVNNNFDKSKYHLIFVLNTIVSFEAFQSKKVV